jgi:hypothetical protein
MDNTLPTEASGTAGGSGLANQAPATGAGTTANQPQSSQERLAAILRKQANKEPLSASERGFLGSQRRKGKAMAPAPKQSENLLFEAPASLAPAPAPMVAPSSNPLFVAPATDEAPAHSVALPQVDSALVQKSAGAICDAIDKGTQIWISHEAKQAGGDAATVAAYKSAYRKLTRCPATSVFESHPVLGHNPLTLQFPRSHDSLQIVHSGQFFRVPVNNIKHTGNARRPIPSRSNRGHALRHFGE